MNVTSTSTYLIALGGNMPSVVGSPPKTLQSALERLDEMGGHVIAISKFYQTPCFPVGAGPDYVNAAAKIQYAGDPWAFLAMLHDVETEFGRERVQRWGRRTLDLDLVAAGQDVVPNVETYVNWRDLSVENQMQETPDQLILPHPRMQDRAFVLIPLLDIAADWRHPVLGRSVSEMTANLPEIARNEVVAL